MCEKKFRVELNPNLLEKQNVKHRENAIKFIHEAKLEIFTAMNITDEPEMLQSMDKLLTELEFTLQDLWGFPRDARYHKFWERPRCDCPKLDNEDFYPTGRSYYNSACPLHGKFPQKK